MSETSDTPAEAQIVSPKERSSTVPLEWPIEFDGKLYESITIRRCSGREVDQFIAAVTTAANGANLKTPMIDCPDEVWAVMDDDDRLRLEEAVLPFLPRRLAQAAESPRKRSRIRPASSAPFLDAAPGRFRHGVARNHRPRAGRTP